MQLCVLFLSITAMYFVSVTTIVPKEVDILLLSKLLFYLVDIYSFFVVHYTDEISVGHALSIIGACITFAMLAILIHEERGAPAQPIFSDTVSPQQHPGYDNKMIYDIYRTAPCQPRCGLHSTPSSCLIGLLP